MLLNGDIQNMIINHIINSYKEKIYKSLILYQETTNHNLNNLIIDIFPEHIDEINLIIKQWDSKDIEEDIKNFGRLNLKLTQLYEDLVWFIKNKMILQ